MKTGLHIFLSVFFLSGFCTAQWIQQNSNTTETLNAVKFYSTETGIITGNNGLILKTMNGGADWIPKQSGTTRNLLCMEIIDDDICIAAGVQKIIKSTDSGESWFSVYNGTLTFNGLEFIDSLVGFAAGGTSSGTPLARILKTTDGGLSWHEVYAQNHFPFWDISFADLSNGMAAGASGRIIKTTDSGASWSQMVSTVSDDIFCIKYNDINNAVASGLQMILRSINGGITWNLVASPSMSAIHCISFADMLCGYAVGSQGVNGNTLILRSTNGGLNWTEEIFFADYLNSVHFVDLNTGTAVGGTGTILHITNAGLPVELSSFKIESSTSSARLLWVTASEINNHGFEIERTFLDQEWATRGFVSGAGSSTECREYEFTDILSEDGAYKYRLKQIDFNGSYQYSEVLDFSYYTLNYSLEQNYPNPFNPATIINYSIPDAGRVKLTVYDLLGRETIRLVDEDKPAGSYTVEFNAERLSSGMYLYQINSGTFVQVKKMTLLK